MSLDKRVLETIKNKIAEESEDSKISKILIEWLNNIDEGKERFRYKSNNSRINK